ncbi:MAG: Holliday junction resolvase RuvX [Candidatus Marinimicrobia bacterium]|nr:Holliday junction resolvase RuvX [Candidatus Neomarinimicrobiota bacterium]|tara:strand:- start:733 stop:1146 length:414 start_codon:yes stop_codon:yes gene_type:complete
MGRLLGIDYGEKRIGISISDSNRIIASPLETIAFESESSLIKTIRNIILSLKVEGIILGFPIGLNGKDTSQTKKVCKFYNILVNEFKIPVIKEDERLSSVAASNSLRVQGIKPSRNKNMVDSTAAAIILQSYIDRKN